MFLYLVATALGRHPVSNRDKNWILARTACMGNDSLKLVLGTKKIKIWHIQKCRIDLLEKEVTSNKFPLNLIPFKFIERQDVKQCVAMQDNLKFPNAIEPKFILFDSFSELTDQEFVYQGTSFYCSYSDLKKKYQGERAGITSKGLISLEILEEKYYKVFTALRNRYPNSPLIFLHFPTHKEERKLFKDRAIAIAQAIENLCTELTYLHSVSIPSELLNRDLAITTNDDRFPYHYGSEIYEYLAGEIKRILLPE